MLNEIDPNVVSEKKVREVRILDANKKKHKIDVIIPYSGQHAKTISLVESFLLKVRNVDYKLLLVNDGKKNDGFEDIFKSLNNIELHSTGFSKGFGAAVNFGVAKSTSDLCCVMHNDTVVEDPNFLKILLDDLIKCSDKSVVTISSVTNNPMNSKLDFMKKGLSENSPPALFNADVYSPFICTLFYKKIFVDLGGFPEYPFCWFEGDLLGEKIIKDGYRQAYSNSSYIYHVGGGTIKNLINSNVLVKDALKNNYLVYQKDRENLSRK